MPFEEPIAAETALTHIEPTWVTLADLVSDGVLLCGGDGRIAYANPAIRRMLGLADAELLGQSRSLFDDRLLDGTGLPMPLPSSPDATPVRCLLRQEDGAYRPGTLTLRAIGDDGQLVITFAVENVIAEHTITLPDPPATSHPFFTVFHAAPFPLSLHAMDDRRLLDVNRAWEETSGWSRADALGKTVLDLGIFDQETLGLVSRTLYTEGMVRNLELTVTRRDGRKHHILFFIAIVELDGQKCFLSSAINITTRVQTSEALQESETRYRALVECSPAATYIDRLAPDFPCIFLTPQIEQMLGYTVDELIGSADRWHACLHPDDRERVIAQSRLLLRDRQAYTLEYRMIARDGRTVWLRDIGAVVGDGEFIQGILLDITEQKQAEEALRDSETRYRALVECIPAAIYLNRFAPGFPSVFLSPQIETILGYTIHELVDNPTFWRDRIPPEDRERLAAYEQRLIATRQTETFEYRMMARNGRMVWLQCTGTLLYDTEGNPQFEQGVLLDITANKDAEVARKESERQLHEAERLAHVGRYDIDAATLEVQWSDETFRIMGLDPAGHAPSVEEQIAAIHDDDRAHVRLLVERLLTDGGTFDFTYRVVRPDGSIRHVETIGTTRQDAEGKVVAISGTLLDIEERKRAEIELRQAYAELDERVRERTASLEMANARLREEMRIREAAQAAVAREQALLTAVFDLLPFPVGIIGPPHEILRVNQASEQFLRHHGDGDWSGITFLDPNTRQPTPPEQWVSVKAMRGEATRNRESLAVLPDGRELPVLLNAAPFLFNDLRAAIIALQDISALKEADRAKDEFLAILSHELQTPLTCILSWAELAQANPSPDFVGQALEIVNANALRLKGLVTELLDMSRIIHRKLVIDRQLVDLAYETQVAVIGIRHEADRRGVFLTLDACHDPLPVFVDPMRLQQCIGNLLQNSLKFTSTGGHIRLTLARDGEMAVLSVQDDGCGIAPEQLATIFVPFRQGEQTHREGLGLGLSLVRGLIELHDGTVVAESAGPGQGSRFTIRLPLCGEA